jgi:amino acid adenylation domain-containing protein
MASENPLSKRDLVAKLVRERLGKNSASLAIPRRQSGNRIPLSSGQERLWFLEQFDPDSRAYNRPAHIRFKGRLKVDALEQTLNRIVERHETLRTSFPADENGPRQDINPELVLSMPVVDLSDLNAQDCECEARRLAGEETLLPFDLSRGPLIRAKLLRLNQEEYILLLTFHHIVFDGWSQMILHREISMLYQAFTNQTANEIEALPIQYADYAVWQRKRLEANKLEKALSYWLQHLNGCPDSLALPTDHPRPQVQAFSGARHQLLLSNSLVSELKQFSRQNETTLFTTLLTAYFILLHRYSGQTDIAVGFPIAGRSHPEVEPLIGFFINTLVLRADLSGTDACDGLLKMIHQLIMQAYEHQELPFEKLVEKLDLKRDLSRSPLFQVFFQLRNYPKQVLRLDELQSERFEIDSTVEKFDLFIDAIEQEDGELSCLFRYHVALFDPETIRQMAGHFQTILEAMVANPSGSIPHLNLLNPEERKQVLAEWNQTDNKQKSGTSIPELFELQVARHSSKVALGFSNQTLTYGALNEQANKLARYLCKLGVGTDTLVGLFLKPSLERMVALMAILKAGGAFVPLDPDLSGERLALLLDGVKLLITQSELAKQLPVHAAQVVDLDSVEAQTEETCGDNLPVKVQPDHLAYVIYTSGSTGKPKGVMIEHGSFINLVESMCFQPGFSEDDVLLSITSLSFDIGVLEVLLPLLTGSQLQLLGREIAKDGRQLIAVLSRSSATMMMGTPATWRMLIDSGWQGNTGLTVITAGEALSPDLARQLLERVGSLWNFYGPTETTVYSTGIQILPGFESVTIGRPIDNTQCYILDGNSQPVPVGVPGLLFIGGLGLARGYWNQPELTARSFVTNPFPERPDDRIYATGDLVRWRRNGEIEFLGRIDHQLKIRGFRIEPAEIELALKEHPAVKDCVVVGREDTPGDLRLIAYLVPWQTGPRTEATAAEIPWEAWQDEQVSQWESVWNHTFSAPPESMDPTCNTAGVISSYTGELIPPEETRVWVDTAAKRILDLKPDRVLDIGCGLGRTLFRVAPYCSRYWGADFSKPALDYVERHLHLLKSNSVGATPPDIRLMVAAAHELADIAPDSFDLVIINGVVMYFPSMGYLVDVVERALEIVTAGGHIFIGDVRSLPLLEAFHLSVSLHKAEKDEGLEEFWQRVQTHAMEEEELLVAPEFFKSLHGRYPQISQVEIHLKRGKKHNELTRFRYDVILHVGVIDSSVSQTHWLDWDKTSLSLSDLYQRLRQDELEHLTIRKVPNKRVFPEVSLIKSFGSSSGKRTVDTLKEELELARAGALDPEEFWAISDELPYRVDLTWSDAGPEYFDVILRRQTQVNDSKLQNGPVVKQAPSATAWAPNDYGNNPLHAKMSRALSSVLRAWTEQKLAPYMIPSFFMFLNEIPLTSSGKVDRRALPVPVAPGSIEKAALPRSDMEKIIAAVWSEVLNLDQVGIRDNFFELGGHSLSATMVLNRLRKKLTVEVRLLDMFRAPTIEELAERLEAKGGRVV